MQHRPIAMPHELKGEMMGKSESQEQFPPQQQPVQPGIEREMEPPLQRRPPIGAASCTSRGLIAGGDSGIGHAATSIARAPTWPSST